MGDVCTRSNSAVFLLFYQEAKSGEGRGGNKEVRRTLRADLPHKHVYRQHSLGFLLLRHCSFTHQLAGKGLPLGFGTKIYVVQDNAGIRLNDIILWIYICVINLRNAKCIEKSSDFCASGLLCQSQSMRVFMFVYSYGFQV